MLKEVERELQERAFMNEDLSREEVHETVDRMVEELLAAAGVVAPPVDAIKIAQGHLGMIVCLDRRQQQRGRAQRAGGQRQIFLRPEPCEERHQWTVAHEIGEHFKGDLLSRLGLEPGQTRAMAGESLANLFAYRLLVPTAWLRDDAPACDFDLLQLKTRYATTSHEVISWRLLDLPQPCIITVVDNDRIHRRRSNAWRVRKELHAVEAECQRRVSSSGEPHVLARDGWTVQGWPVHKAEWKREVLRSVVEATD
jgi:Zn-dependent peptidase ImmA (M78 family)